MCEDGNGGWGLTSAQGMIVKSVVVDNGHGKIPSDCIDDRLGPSVAWNSQGTDGIEHADNLDQSRAVRRETVRHLDPMKWSFGVPDTCDPLLVSLGLTEAGTVVVIVVPIHTIKVMKVVHLGRQNDANVGNEASYRAGGVCPPGEPKTHDFIAQGVVVDDEVVCFQDIGDEAITKQGLTDSLGDAYSITSADTWVVKHCLRDVAFSEPGYGTSKPGDVGGNIFQMRHRILPRTVATDNDSLRMGRPVLAWSDVGNCGCPRAWLARLRFRLR